MRKRAFSLCLLGCLMSASVYAQQITMKFQRETLPTALMRIEKATSYKFVFVFVYDDVNNRLVTANFTKATIQEVMNTLLAGHPLTYTINGNIITITKGEPKRIDGRVRGTVSDKRTGEPLIGATVKVVGSANNGTMTDADGRFVLQGVPEGAQLVVSCIGMTTATFRAAGQMDIKLTEDQKTLNDVVVVGYGTTQRKDLTGSVTTVDPKDLVNAPFVTIDDALAGKASGVQVTKADGSPGGAVRIRIRGGSSLQGGVDPLYVIDGIPTEIQDNYMSTTDMVNPVEAANYGDNFGSSISGAFARGLNSLSGLNINDIESISIMKDASATAIYGSKAANGVVIITTKRGRRDTKPQFNVNYSFSAAVPKKEKVLNGEQYLDALHTAIANGNAAYKRNHDSGDIDDYTYNYSMNTNNNLLGRLTNIGNANTDWLDAVLRTGIANHLNFSVTGGSAKFRYYNSVSYSHQTGTVIGSDYHRLTANISMDNDITDRFRTFTKLNLSYDKTNISSGVYSQALYAPPTLPIYNADGTFATYEQIGGIADVYMGFQNPVAVASATNNAKTYAFSGSLSMEYDILKELKFRSTMMLKYANYNQLNYIPSYLRVSTSTTTEASGGGQGSQSQSNSTGMFWENTLTYRHEFNEKHRIDAVAGTSWEEDKVSYFSASGRGYPDDKYLNNLSSAAIATSVAGASPSSRSSLLSFYLRANYTLMDRYLFTFTGRSDASSKFSKAHRTGYFPSGAVAWRLSEEKFMEKATWIDELKLRASYGKTGTQNISDWMYLTLYTPDSYAGYNILYPSQLGNDDIRWESTVQRDLGLDYSFFNGRLRGTVEYYHKTTDGALLSVTPAPSSGFTTVITNIANIRNRGWEGDISGDIIRSKYFNWNMGLNISHNDSKVTEIQGKQFTNSAERNVVTFGTSIIREGESLGLLFGRKAVGIITTEEQLSDYKARYPNWKYNQRDLGIGSIEYAIDPETKSPYQDVIGNCTPDFFGGWSNSFSYKNWTLMANFTFSYGNDMIYQKDVTDMNFNSLANRGTRILDASTTDQLTDRPISVYNNVQNMTNLNVYDASYLKLQTLSLAYNFGKRVLDTMHLNQLQLYATVTNLFTITKYPGADPAVSDNPYSVSGGGRDISSYPTSKSFTVGVRLDF